MKKKIVFALGFALFLASCASTPKNEPVAEPTETTTQITADNQPHADTREADTENSSENITPAESMEHNPQSNADVAAEDTENIGDSTPAEDSSAPSAENTAPDSEDEVLERVEIDDILPSEEVKQAFEEVSAPSATAEPTVIDAPEEEILIDPNATNSLAETEADAQGTTPIQQPTENHTVTERQTATDIRSGSATSETFTQTNSTQPKPAQTISEANSRGKYANETTETLKTNETLPVTQNTPLVAQTGTQSTAQGGQNQRTDTATEQNPLTSDKQMSDSTAEEAETSDSVIPLEKQTVTPSRSMTIKNNQYLDIIYPGSGWVYLGEAEENRDQKKNPLFSYFGRKLGTADTTFTLRSRKPGKTLLHFYKNDALTGQYIDDYLEVNIENESAKAGVRATAPAYSEAVPPKPTRQTRESYENIVSTEADENNSTALTASPALSSGAQFRSSDSQTNQSRSSNEASTMDSPQNASSVIPAVEDKGVKTVIQTTESAPEGDAKTITGAPAYSGTTGKNASDSSSATVSPQETEKNSGLDLLEQAKRSYAAKQYETALDQVQRYLQDATTKIDEALYLQGQVLEAESSIKSIRSAIDSYESLTKNYPMSPLWGKANNRIIYLKRFYIEIR